MRFDVFPVPAHWLNIMYACYQLVFPACVVGYAYAYFRREANGKQRLVVLIGWFVLSVVEIYKGINIIKKPYFFLHNGSVGIGKRRQTDNSERKGQYYFIC